MLHVEKFTGRTYIIYKFFRWQLVVQIFFEIFSTRLLQVVETSKEFFFRNQNSCRAQCDKYSIIEGNFKFLPQCILTIGIVLKINRQSRIELKKSESILTEGRHFRSKISKLSDV